METSHAPKTRTVSLDVWGPRGAQGLCGGTGKGAPYGFGVCRGVTWTPDSTEEATPVTPAGPLCVETVGARAARRFPSQHPHS